MSSPHFTNLENLESKFKENGGEFREHEIGKLFTHIPPFKYRFNKGDLPKEATKEFDLPAITCQSTNNGISCYVNKSVIEKQSILKNVISVAANGDAPAFYQRNEFMILQDAYALEFTDQKLGEKCYLYLTAVIQKVLTKYDWNNKSGWAKIKNEKIKLPTHANGTLAFDFMESYIAELESQRIAELNAYLKATNLSDYELTEEEMEALKTFENLVAKLDSNPCHTESTPCHVERSEVSSFCHVERSETSHQSETSTIRDASLMAQHDKVGKTAQNDKMGENVESQNDKVSPATAEGGLQASAYKTNPPITFKEFKIGELFSVKSNPQLNKDSFEFSENGEYPYFTRTCLNNGINGYVEYLDEEHKIKGNSIAVGMLGMQFFYMKKDFYAGQFTKTIYPKFGELNTKIALYFISMFNKSSQHFLRGLVRDFENLFVNHKIYLPITSDQKIAFDFMESFIKAIEKQTIKGVVEFANKNIEATKRVVQNIS